VRVGQLERVLIPSRARRDRCFEHDRTCADLDDRERVHVSARIDADDLVNFICKHP
jgi:hypothetical protein